MNTKNKINALKIIRNYFCGYVPLCQYTITNTKPCKCSGFDVMPCVPTLARGCCTQSIRKIKVHTIKKSNNNKKKVGSIKKNNYRHHYNYMHHYILHIYMYVHMYMTTYKILRWIYAGYPCDVYRLLLQFWNNPTCITNMGQRKFMRH